ncbi:MAG: ribonuclease P protein component [Proteobacteria bacterium]|nr:ribonuclease P protein component [Pseudomonadota bacterium]
MLDREQGATGTEVVDLGFRNEHRLHTPADFSTVFTVRRVLRGELFNLHYAAKTAGTGSGPVSARLGLVIAKKLAHRAVQRNLLKRLAREAFRLARQGLPSYDLVLRLAKQPGTSLDRTARKTWRADIERLFSRLPR